MASPVTNQTHGPLNAIVTLDPIALTSHYVYPDPKPWTLNYYS